VVTVGLRAASGSTQKKKKRWCSGRSVWALADWEWRAAAPGLKPLGLPRAPMAVIEHTHMQQYSQSAHARSSSRLLLDTCLMRGVSSNYREGSVVKLIKLSVGSVGECHSLSFVGLIPVHSMTLPYLHRLHDSGLI